MYKAHIPKTGPSGFWEGYSDTTAQSQPSATPPALPYSPCVTQKTASQSKKRRFININETKPNTKRPLVTKAPEGSERGDRKTVEMVLVLKTTNISS